MGVLWETKRKLIYLILNILILCLEFGIGNVEMGKFSLKFIFIEYSPLKTFNFKRFLSRCSNTTLLLLQFEWHVSSGIHWTHRMKAYHFHCAFTNDISMYWKIVRLTITAYYRKLLALVKQLTVTYSHTHIHIHIRIHKDLPWKMNIVLASQITENIVQVCLSVWNTPSQTVFL